MTSEENKPEIDIEIEEIEMENVTEDIGTFGSATEQLSASAGDKGHRNAGTDFAFDIAKKRGGSGLKKVAAPALVLLLAAGAGGFILTNPDIVGKLISTENLPFMKSSQDGGASPFSDVQDDTSMAGLPQPSGSVEGMPALAQDDPYASSLTPEPIIETAPIETAAEPQEPRGPEDILDVTAVTTAESPVAALADTGTDQAAADGGPSAWQAPALQDDGDVNAAAAAAAGAAAALTPAAETEEPVASAVQVASAVAVANENSEVPAFPEEAGTPDVVPPAQAAVTETPSPETGVPEVGSFDQEPAVQAVSAVESAPPDMPASAAQETGSVIVPAAPSEVEPYQQTTIAQATPPADAPATVPKGNTDTYYDSGINLPKGPLAKETIRVVDPTIEPAQKMVIAKKDHNKTSQEALLESASRALKLQRYDAALDMYEQLYAKNPRDRRILMGLAVAQQHAGRSDAAIQTYETLLDIDPKNPDAMVNMLGLLRQQYPEVALRRLIDLQDKFPNNAGIAAQIGITQADLGYFDDAVHYMQIAASLEPQNAQHLYNIAVVADRKGAKADAIKYYEQALEIDAIYGASRTLNREAIYDRLAKLRRT